MATFAPKRWVGNDAPIGKFLAMLCPTRIPRCGSLASRVLHLFIQTADPHGNQRELRGRTQQTEQENGAK